MAGEADLRVLLRSMQPDLHDVPYGFGVVKQGQAVPDCFARIVEPEGVTAIAPLADLAVFGIPVMGSWARISLTVHSDLAAVGLTAAFAGALAAQGISANVVAGFYHDHLFVQWERRADAMAALKELGNV